MPTALDFDIEVSTRVAQANAIVQATNDLRHESLFEDLQRAFDALCTLYQPDEAIPEDAYVALVHRVDELYYTFVRMTGGRELLQRDRTRPRDNSPLRYKLTPHSHDTSGRSTD